jgi:hypothetical protein
MVQENFTAAVAPEAAQMDLAEEAAEVSVVVV